MIEHLRDSHGQDKEHGGLKILIVGAGIGGLVAAIALRQQGHDVALYEQSRLASETGAAIHLAPNCNGLLRRLGLDLASIGATLMRGINDYGEDGQLIRSLSFEGRRVDMWQHPWEMVHRLSLHSALKKLATEAIGKGKPATVHTSSRAVLADASAATITLANGDVIEGDVVVGADGVHSLVRKAVPGGDKKAFDSGDSAFRFMIERKTLLQDPVTAPIVRDLGRMASWTGHGRRLVMYPCNDNQLMNFAAIHPSNESDARGTDWSESSSTKLLYNLFQSFGTQVQRIISHVDPATLKVWTLLDMEILPNMIHDRLALIGDAAHPFLPYQGQGGAQAMEDAVALAVVLPQNTPKTEICDRLKLYEQCRYERAHKVQQITRSSGQSYSGANNQRNVASTIENLRYNFNHDAWDFSHGKLRKWQAERSPNKLLRMPTSFGPAPGPLKDHVGGSQTVRDSSVLTSSIKFTTSRTFLENLFPSPQFSFASPGTVVHASISCSTFDHLSWLGGAGYSSCGLYIHNVRYTKKDGTSVTGTYIPVLFENLVDPILSGRDDLGLPKLYCDLASTLEKESAEIRMSWHDTKFATLTWTGLEEVIAAADVEGIGTREHASRKAPDEGLLAYRYVPAVGRPGVADAEYAVIIPTLDKNEQPRPRKVLKSSKASISFEARSSLELPTLHNIVATLAEVPVFSVIEAKIVEGIGEDFLRAERIE